ncbi:MAG: hypothetical protein JNL39_20115 [Opitutaceae bacterium]|nr:hypothetical protein [Opitutaceae bacterium]
MLKPLRHAVAIAWALSPAFVLGATQPAATAPATLPPELAALLAPPSLWSVWSRVEADYGYKDNLLLSSSGEERSAFARASAEFGVLRLPGRGFDCSLLTEVAGTHYFNGRSTNHDARAFFFGEAGWQPASSLRISLPLVGSYKDEAIDQSDTDIVRIVSVTKVAGVNLGPAVRWTFHPAWSIEAQAAGERRHFEGGVNDFDIGAGALRLGWKPHARFKVRLGAEQRWRDFKERAQYSAAGRELAGTSLKAAEREAKARIEFKWDRAGRWQTTTRASVLTYRDNGSGYFNFSEQALGHEVEWNRAPWLVRVGGSARRVEFDVQTVGFGISPPPRVRDEFSAEFRVERELTPRWAVVARYEWERSRSNDPLSSYVMNEGLLGLRWSWEK